MDHALLPNINIPTRVETKNGTITSSLIDNILTKMDFPGDYNVLTDPIADHFILMLQLHNQHKKKPKKQFYFKRDFTDEKIANLKEHLNTIDWSYLENCETDEAVAKFTTFFSAKLDEFIPLQKYERKARKNNPWFSKGLQISKNKLNKLLRNYNKKPTSVNKIRLDTYNKEYKKLIRQAKNKYYINKLNNSWGNSKQQWNLVNSLTGRLKNDTHAVSNLLINNKLTSNSKHIATAFAEYFSQIGVNLVKDQHTDMAYHNYLDNYKPKATFKFKPVTISMVKKTIRSLQNKNSSGEDGISNKILKIFNNEICRPITYILNLSIKNNYYPKQWRLSKVITLFKKGDKTELGNYRPISLQNVLSKVMERIVKTQLMAYLEENELLPQNQYGFRNKQGINHLHLFLQNKITAALNKKQIFKLCLLDYSKAFDVVNFKILLKKLKCLGIQDNELEWFKSYLYDRHMYCVVNNTISLKRPTESGVPQGTVLGPILFLIYTFDLINFIQNYCSFADDTSVFNVGDTEKEASQKLTESLEIVNKWVKNNKLKLNADKTKIITFGAEYNNINLTNIEFNGTTLENVDEYKLLGITIDKNLSWKPHIDSLHKKLKFINYTINKLKNTMPEKSKLLLYNALFNSTLSFGIPIWGRHLPNKIKSFKNYSKENAPISL